MGTTTEKFDTNMVFCSKKCYLCVHIDKVDLQLESCQYTAYCKTYCIYCLLWNVIPIHELRHQSCIKVGVAYYVIHVHVTLLYLHHITLHNHQTSPHSQKTQIQGTNTSVFHQKTEYYFCHTVVLCT